MSLKAVTLVFLLKSNGQILLAMKKRGFGIGKWNGNRTQGNFSAI
jgi:hypothetical protein